MKVKLNLYITNPEDFMKGDYEWCFKVSSDDSLDGNGWMACGDADLNVNVDNGEVIASSVRELSKQIDEEKSVFSARLHSLEERKARLLAITHDDYRQKDRTVSGGKVKTATGYVEEPTCTDKADFK